MSATKYNLEDIVKLLESDSAQDHLELNQILRDNQDLRNQLAAFLIDEEIIRDELKMYEVEKIVSDDSIIPITRPKKSDRKKIQFFGGALAGAAAAAAIIIGVLTLPKLYHSDPKPKLVDAVDTKPSWIAKVKASSPDVTWQNESYQKGANIPLGKHHLLTGQLAVIFSNDVEIVIKAPSIFDIKSNMEVVLHNGSLRATVSEAGYGFVVDTPKTRVRDLGTEFGVSVGDDQQTEVHVFSGEVELYDTKNSPPELAREGFAARWKKEGRTILDTPNEAAFPNDELIRYNQWKSYQQSIVNDPSTAAYFDFQKIPNHPSILSNLKGNISDGIIHNPSWVTGRWPEKQALLFDLNNSWVDLKLPTKDKSFTVQIWIKPDRFASSLNAVLNSVSWKAYGHHLQITNRGELRVGVGGPDWYAITSDPNGIPLGKWSLLSFTYDINSKKVSYYINDKKVLEEISKAPYIDLSLSSIGCWKVKKKATRKFRGRIDELIVRYRCLSDQEIKDSYLAGSVD